MAEAKITSRTRVTIPKAVRDRLGLKAGHRVQFLMQEDGTALLVPLTVQVADLQGVLGTPKAPVSIADMNRAIRSGAVPDLKEAHQST